VGILALLMIAERLIYFARKNTTPRPSRTLPALRSRGAAEARELCAKSAAPWRAPGALARKGSAPRFRREGSARSLLREVPALEKRLPLIAAHGRGGPLRGLLGTVSGLVTLFRC